MMKLMSLIMKGGDRLIFRCSRGSAETGVIADLMTTIGPGESMFGKTYEQWLDSGMWSVELDWENLDYVPAPEPEPATAATV